MNAKKKSKTAQSAKSPIQKPRRSPDDAYNWPREGEKPDEVESLIWLTHLITAPAGLTEEKIRELLAKAANEKPKAFISGLSRMTMGNAWMMPLMLKNSPTFLDAIEPKTDAPQDFLKWLAASPKDNCVTVTFKVRLSRDEWLALSDMARRLEVSIEEVCDMLLNKDAEAAANGDYRDQERLDNLAAYSGLSRE